MFYDENLIIGSLIILGYPTLAIAAWIYLYLKGASARDFIFWGVIMFLIPILGSIAVFLFFPRQRKKETLD